MTLPNKLTMFRIILIPVMVTIAYIPFFNENFVGPISLANFINVFVFVIASLTDFLDGHIARKRNLVTTFGKFADPLADKLLVGAALICLVETGQLPAWVVVIIISREFIISGFRLIASDNGVVIAASYWGKFKTVTQMAMVILIRLR